MEINYNKLRKYIELYAIPRWEKLDEEWPLRVGGGELYIQEQVLKNAAPHLTKESLLKNSKSSLLKALSPHRNLLSQFEGMHAKTFLEQSNEEDLQEHAISLLFDNDALKPRIKLFLEWAKVKSIPGEKKKIGVNATVCSYFLSMANPRLYPYCKPVAYKGAVKTLLSKDEIKTDPIARIIHCQQLYSEILSFLEQNYGLEDGNLLDVHSLCYLFNTEKRRHPDGNDSFKFIESFIELQNRIKEWSDGFFNRSPSALNVASKTAHWYYSPIYDTFGPSKFIGYKNISLDDYISDGLDGRDTEKCLKNLNEYEILENDNPNYKTYYNKLESFLGYQNKIKKSNAKIHISEKNEIRKLMFQLHLASALYSYKYVMLSALLRHAENPSKSTNEYFWEYYRDRKIRGLLPEKKGSSISKADLEVFSPSQINSILDSPFEAINNCASDQPVIIRDNSKYRFNDYIINEMKNHKQELSDFINFKLRNYFENKEKCQFWWVNQSKTYATEQEGGFLWAPQKDQRQTLQFHWKNVNKVKKGDIIFHYATGNLKSVSIAQTDGYASNRPEGLSGGDWAEQGWRVDVLCEKLTDQIPIKKIGANLAKLDMKYGPINKAGGVNEGYLFQLSENAVQIIIKHVSIENLSSEIKSQIEKVLSDDKSGEVEMSASEIIDHVYNRLSSQGFIISKADLINFYCCLRTKPFVLLAGISGTGKTKFVRLFAEAVGATEDNHQFHVIPVRPDWNDNTELLGFFDLNEQYQPGALIHMMIRAHANPVKPYFLCLDEMNLARVEHYFSDFLSIIESRQLKEINGEKRIITDPIITSQQMNSMNSANIDENVANWLTKLKVTSPKGLGIPENIYVIGTVNMDETTHPFSRKVLDRANTIEFNDIHLTAGLTLPVENSSVKSLKLSHFSFQSKYLTMIDLLNSGDEIAKTVSEKLQELNHILSKAGCQIGYRVRDEAAFYMKYLININSPDLDETAGHERVVLQKIMPRIQGSSYQIKQVLENLLEQFVPESSQIEFDDENYIKELQDLIADKGALAKKIGQMLIQFMEDGFTSFWVN